MNRLTAKILALFGTFILPFVCTILPYKVSGIITKKGESGKRYLSYLMCLGGGIFFGTYLLHMGPEVRSILEKSLLQPYNITYPLAELIVGIGFFVVLFAEKIALRWNKKRISRKRQKSCRQSVASAKVHDSNNDKLINHGEQRALVTGTEKGLHCVNPDEACAECLAGKPCSGYDEGEMNAGKLPKIGEPLATRTGLSSDTSTTAFVDIEDLSSCVSALSNSSCRMAGTGECCNDPPQANKDMSQKEKQIVITMKVADNPLNQNIIKASDSEMDSENHAGHHHATRSLILILALSLHRIFEGMSIGLQVSVTNVASLFIAVMCHETVIGFSLGLQFIKSGFKLQRLLVTSLVCSSIMPVGVLVGLAMTETGSDASYVEIANGILQAIAMGTFIYVTFFEILQEEIDPEDTSLSKIVCIAAGFVMMALLDLIPEEQNPTPSLDITTVATLLVVNSTSAVQ